MKKNRKSLVFAAILALGFGLSAQAVQAKELKLGVDADAESLDIHMQLSGNILNLSHTIFDPLVRFDKHMKIEPRLATKWEQINPTTLRVHLRDDVTFHSGNHFTADDVVWTLNRIKTSQDFKGIFLPVTKATKVDDYTVDFITEKPYPLMLNIMTYVFPMDHKFYTGKDKDGKDKSRIDKASLTFADQNESGTGPFMVQSREQGVKTVFVRFPKYWDKASKGNVDKITMSSIKENATRVAALLSGDLNLISPVAPTEFKRIKANKNFNLVTIGGERIITIQMNEKTSEPLRNQKVREAIVYAVNNKGIAEKIMDGFATVAAQQSPEGYQGYNASLKPRYDLAKAKQLMKEAGYEKGFTLSMISPNNRYVNDEKIAQAVAAMLSKINIKVNLKTMPISLYWPEFDKCASDLQLVGWQADTEDSANITQFLTMTRDEKTGNGQYNCNGYSNPKVDSLIVQAETELNVEKRKAMLQNVEKILYDDAAFIPLHFQNLSWAEAKNVHINDVVNATSFPHYGDLIID